MHKCTHTKTLSKHDLHCIHFFIYKMYVRNQKVGHCWLWLTIQLITNSLFNLLLYNTKNIQNTEKDDKS